MRADIISVVAGGWSLRDVDRDRIPGFIIGVNESAILLPRCDLAVSMDRLWTENRWEHLARRRMPSWLRRSAVQNIADRPDWLTVFDNDHKAIDFTDEPLRLNGTNSGLCAFNRAWQLRPAVIYLYAFDMCRGPKGEAYWHEPYSWGTPQGDTSNGRYKEWAGQFAAAAKACRAAGIKVFNLSPVSAIPNFPKVVPDKVPA